MATTEQIEADVLLAGRYRVLDHLGAGGMSVVVLAEDTVLGRRVAVKRLRSTRPEGPLRFEREARLGAHLNHPNIVSVFDTVSDPDEVLIIMEYVPGRPLSELIKAQPLSPPQAVAVARGVAEALDHAHAHGVVHRDVKPANVLLRDDGVVKLADLGVATGEDVSQITNAGDVVGTLAYIAPERFESDRPATPAADVYALAAVIFEALSGHAAQRGTTPFEVLDLAANAPPPDIRDVWADAPAEAADVLRRGLDPDPTSRPATASELVDKLEEALAVRERPGAGQVLPAQARVLTPGEKEVATLMRERGAGRRLRRGVLAGIVAALAALAALAIVLNTSDGGDASPAREGSRAGSTGSGGGPGEPSSGGDGAGSVPAAASGGATGAAADATDGYALNDQGYALIQQERYQEAVPVLRRAVGSFPEGTTDLTYAYALYNLGHALRLAGRPDEAIPILEQRLAIPNQRGVVKRELEAARTESAGAGGAAE